MTKVIIKGFNENADVETIKEFVIETTMISLYNSDGTNAYTLGTCDTLEILSDNNEYVDIVTITFIKSNFSIAVFNVDKVNFIDNQDNTRTICVNGDKF